MQLPKDYAGTAFHLLDFLFDGCFFVGMGSAQQFQGFLRTFVYFMRSCFDVWDDPGLPDVDGKSQALVSVSKEVHSSLESDDGCLHHFRIGLQTTQVEEPLINLVL